MRTILGTCAGLLPCALVACADAETPREPAADSGVVADEVISEPVEAGRQDARAARTIYVMTNSPDGNAVHALRHVRGDSFRPIGRYATGGTGTGTDELPTLEPGDGIDPLVSEGSLRRAGDHLLAVNTGSRSVTSFLVMEGGALEVAGTAQVDAYPNTIAHHAGQVYVGLSPGPDGEAGIAQLRLRQDGVLEPAGDTVPLASHPAEVHVTEDGRFLVATLVLEDTLVVFPIDADGQLGEPVETASSGPGPFAVESRDDLLIVTEAAPGVMGGGSLSTYRLADDGSLSVVSASVGNEQSATCWLELTPTGHVITSNTESGTLSTWRLNDDGTIELVEGAASTVGAAPIDLAVAGDFVFTLLGANGSVAVNRLGPQLRYRGSEVVGLPVLGAQGLVAW